MNYNITSVHFREYDEEKDKNLRQFDNTKLTALNTCPTWGIIRYEQHKTFSTSARSMPLEAGAACHKVFAAIRFMSLIGPDSWYLDDGEALGAINQAAHANLGSEMWNTCVRMLEVNRYEPFDRALILASLEAFALSGYYEDPSDRRRTIANIEEALIAYVDRYPYKETQPIVMKRGAGTWFVGVECAFNLTLRIGVEDEEIYGERAALYRFKGRIDGIHWLNSNKETIVVEENKTASRLNTAWEESFKMSHQITGYMLAACHLLSQGVDQISDATVRGMAIPLPKTYDYGGIVNVPVRRTYEDFRNWGRWVYHTMETTQQWLDDPIKAPRYTHSCNRYFRPCSMLPFCDSPSDEQELMLDEMAIDEWDVLENEG